MSEYLRADPPLETSPAQSWIRFLGGQFRGPTPELPLNQALSHELIRLIAGSHIPWCLIRNSPLLHVNISIPSLYLHALWTLCKSCIAVARDSGLTLQVTLRGNPPGEAWSKITQDSWSLYRLVLSATLRVEIFGIAHFLRLLQLL